MSTNLDNFRHLISDEPSGWLKAARRRKRWRWLTILTLRPRIKYYRWKRAFKLFILRVVARFYDITALQLLLILGLMILLALFAMLIVPFIEYYTGVNVAPWLYN